MERIGLFIKRCCLLFEVNMNIMISGSFGVIDIPETARPEDLYDRHLNYVPREYTPSYQNS